jgi:heptosyltransferase-2
MAPGVSARGASASDLPGAWAADAWRGPLLVIRLSSLGDVVLTSGPLRLLRQRRPDLRIELLTRRAFAPLWDGSRLIDGLSFDDPSAPDGAAPTRGAASSSARIEPPALVIDWQGGRRGRRAAARHAGGVPIVRAARAALHRRLLVLCGLRIPAPEPFAIRLARSVTGASVPPELVAPEVRADTGSREALRAHLRALGDPAGGWAVLAPGASRRMKAVPAVLAAAITADLRAMGMGVIELVAPEAPDAPAPAARNAPDATEEQGPLHGRFETTGDLCLRFTGPLREVIALLAEARLFVGSDSGILHIATGVDTPAVGLFGPTVPELGFSPLGRARAVGVELPCRPCHIHGPQRCWLGHARCWRDMTGTDVRAAIAALSSDEIGRKGAGAQG